MVALIPCKDCPDRYPSCHSVCEKYAEYKQRKADIYEMKRKECETVYAQYMSEKMKKVNI